LSLLQEDPPSRTRIQQTQSLPPSHPTFNVYERVDDDQYSGDSLELYQEGSWQNQVHSCRHSWSPLVPADDNRAVHNEEFLQRLDARPPALVPKRNHDGGIKNILLSDHLKSLFLIG